MASPTDLRGFEILQKLYDQQLTRKQDVIILLVHWYFIKCGFKCIGLGDSKQFDPSDTGSELLPEGWNKEVNYTLRYLKDGKLFILHALKSDEDLLINVLRCADSAVSTVHFPIDQTVKSIRGPLESLIPTYQAVLHVLRTDLMQSISPCNVDVQVQAEIPGPSARREPVHVDEPHRPAPRRPWGPEDDPSSIGRADLDPLGRGGGGMIFDPFSVHRNRPVHPGGLGVPGRLPPGAIPPGARFDPFGPPEVNRPRPRRFPPDSDDAPPSGYDDMFM